MTRLFEINQELTNFLTFSWEWKCSSANPSAIDQNDVWWIWRWWSPVKVSVRFQQLIIDYTQLIRSNIDQELRTMVIRLFHRCCCMAGLTPWSSTLKVIVMYPLFIAYHDTMQKNFFLFLSLKQLFTCDKMPFDVSRLQLI